MPKKIDPAVKERALRLLREHRGQYPSLTAVCAAVARQERVGAETVRRWAVQAEIDDGSRAGNGPDARGRRRLTPEGLYGRRKMLACLRRRGVAATPGAVDRGMRRLGLSGVLRTKQVRTTIPGKDGQRAGDLLNRNFQASAPNKVWVSDFTYVRSWAGFVYTAFIVDVFAQRILAWHCATTKHVELVATPLRIALWDRDRQGHAVGPDELICHSDAGSQYTAIRFTEHLALEGISPSIGSVGDHDNALMETINGLYKAECIRTTVFHDGPYKTIADVEYATAGWVDWYNQRRVHSTLGYLTPAEYEDAHYAALNQELLPT